MIKTKKELQEMERDFLLTEFKVACDRMQRSRERKDLIFLGVMIAMEEMNKSDDPGPRIMERVDRAAERGNF